MCEPMEGQRLKHEALRLLNTQGYLAISDLGVAIGGDRVRAMYGVARQIRNLQRTVRDQKKQIDSLEKQIRQRAAGAAQRPALPEPSQDATIQPSGSTRLP